MFPSPFPSASRPFLVSLLAATGLLLPGVGPTEGAARADDNSSPLPLEVRFWADQIELTGAVPDEETADRLRIAVYRAQPGKPLWDRLVIDPERAVLDLPDSDELAGLLLELALSTRDGSLKVTARDLVVSGLTDSLVTHAAFNARLGALSARHGGKQPRNRICLVHKDDLEAALLPLRPRPALRPRPLAIAPVVLADSPYGPASPPARAEAFTSLATNAETPGLASAGTGTKEETPARANRLETLRPVKFAASSYLLGFDQYRLIDTVVARIRAVPKEAGKVILRGFPDTSGRHDYNDWLGLSRAKSVRRALAEAGIAAERFTLQSRDTAAKLGTVSILIPRLTPPPEEENEPKPSPETAAAGHPVKTPALASPPNAPVRH